MAAQVGPQALAADVHHHEGGNGENGAGHQRFAHRGRRAGDVLLQNAAPEKRQAEEGDGDDGGGDGGRHRLTCLHAQIGVGRAEDRRQNDP